MAQPMPTTILKALVFATAGAILTFLLVGMALAKSWRVETERTIAAPPERVAELVTDFSTWPRWSAMRADLGPQTSQTVAGTPHAVGQSITWAGVRGRGFVEVTGTGAAFLDYVVRSQAPGPAPIEEFARGRVEWSADGERTKVRWREERACEGTVERWFAWFGAIQEGVRRIQVSSLTGLAQALEMPAAEASATTGAK
ncbi:MAG: SRPBCC family protein [Planctomycetes bacterium]|nr:SRPBCC family protein [Planctomycetota bacterium]